MKRTGRWGQAQNCMSLFHGAIGAETGRESWMGMEHVVLPADRRCHGRNHQHHHLYYYYQQDLLNQRHKEVKNGLQSEV